MDPAELHNTYFVLRHGTSFANEEGLIVSDPKHGVGDYGLTEKGKSEVKVSVERAKSEGLLDSSTIIISSDFARARESAEIAARILQATEVATSPKLRERFFGAWEKTSNSHYQHVWDSDKDDCAHKQQNVESVAEIVERVASLVRDIESEYHEQKILLVSHGDTLQVLQALFEEIHPSRHRSITHLKTAEIRKLS